MLKSDASDARPASWLHPFVRPNADRDPSHQHGMAVPDTLPTRKSRSARLGKWLYPGGTGFTPLTTPPDDLIKPGMPCPARLTDLRIARRDIPRFQRFTEPILTAEPAYHQYNGDKRRYTTAILPLFPHRERIALTCATCATGGYFHAASQSRPCPGRQYCAAGSCNTCVSLRHPSQRGNADVSHDAGAPARPHWHLLPPGNISSSD